MIHRVTSGAAEPALMDAVVVREARVACPLTREQRARIERDLAAQADALLSDALRAILERDAWVEQETLLDRLSTVLS